MHHNDVLDSKEMLSDRYGTQRVDCTSTSDYNREDRGNRRDLLALFVANNFSGYTSPGVAFIESFKGIFSRAERAEFTFVRSLGLEKSALC